MHRIILGLLVFTAILGAASLTADAAVRVRGYFRDNGTYVQPSYRSNSNSTRLDNWSTRGNYNPYTGKAGYRGF